MSVDNEEVRKLLEQAQADMPGMENAREFVIRFNKLYGKPGAEPHQMGMGLMPAQEAYDQERNLIFSGISPDNLIGVLNQISMIPEEAFVMKDMADFVRGVMVANVMNLYSCQFIFTDENGNKLEEGESG